MKKTFATISLGVMVAVFGLLALPMASEASWGLSVGVGINSGMGMGGYGYGSGYPSYGYNPYQSYPSYGNGYNGGCGFGCGGQQYPYYGYQAPSNYWSNSVSSFSYGGYNPYFYDAQPVNYGITCYRYCY